MNTIIKILITAVTAFGLTKVLPGVYIDSFTTALIFAIVLAVLNAIVKPIFQLIGFPITVVTFGFFSLVINTVVILIADYFVDGMDIDGFWWAFVFSIALYLITSLLNGIFASDDN